MSQTRLEIFKINISNNTNLDLDKKAQEKINEFLSSENNIYINHSTSVITEDIEEYGSMKTISRFLVISIIYKDLNASAYDLKNTNKKVKETVTKEIKDGENISEPKIETGFDKNIKEILNNSKKNNKNHIPS